MNIWDILIIALVAAALVLAVLNRKRKKGGCCGDCADCGGCAQAGGQELPPELRDLQGAWEPGHYGPRVEIAGDTYTQLWQAAPVLETRFRTRREGEKLLLLLERDGLRYAGSEKDYARVKAVWLENGALTVLEDFPITGESSEVLQPTRNSRYGNADPADELLPLLEGEWRCDEADMGFRIRDGRLYFHPEGLGEQGTPVILLRTRGDPMSTAELRDRDPAVRGLGMFGRMTLEGNVILAQVFICDGPTRELRFRKAD